MCLYVDVPEMIHSEEFDASHLQFIHESLRELDIRLRDFGGRLTLRVGSPIEHVKDQEEHSVAYKAALERKHAVRRNDEAKLEAKRVVKKHGSSKRTKQKTKPAKNRQRKSNTS